MSHDHHMTTSDGNTCFYGKCYYCKPEEAACAEGDIMEGSLTLWLPEWYELKTWRHPWQRTYRKGVKARWEKEEDYCQQFLNPSSEYYHGLLEITDAAVFDFLMGTVILFTLFASILKRVVVLAYWHNMAVCRTNTETYTPSLLPVLNVLSFIVRGAALTRYLLLCPQVMPTGITMRLIQMLQNTGK